MCTVSNASLDRFFNHMNIVKTETRNRLSQKSSNAILAIRMFGISLAEFNKSYVKDCGSKWYNDKDQRLGQRKRKAYKKRESVTKKKKDSLFDRPVETRGGCSLPDFS